MYRLSFRVLAVTFALIACAPTLSASGLDHLQALQQELSQVRIDTARGTVAASRQATPAAASRLRRGGGTDARIDGKIAAMASLLGALRESPQYLQTLEARRARFETRDGQRLQVGRAGDVGSSCRAAVVAEPGTPMRLALPGEGSGWVLWRAPEPGVYLLETDSTRIDPALEVYADCGDAEPLAQSDDGFGLDPAVGITASDANQMFFVRVLNLSSEAGELVVAGGASRTISGRITDALTGLPIEGIRLEAFRRNSFQGSAISGTDGNYSIPLYGDSTAGEFAVRTGWYYSGAPDYLHEAWPNTPCRHPDAYYLSQCAGSTTFPIAAGQSVSGIDFVLGPGASIGGRVVDRQSGAAIVDAVVSVADALGEVRVGETDDAGRFALKGLVPGTSFFVTAAHGGYRAQVFSGVDCPESSGCGNAGATAVVGVDNVSAQAQFQLQPMSYIDVDLSIAGGMPYDSWYANVDAFYPNGVKHPASATRLGANRYRVGPLGVGSYLLRAGVSYVAFSQWYGGIDCASDCMTERTQAQAITIASPGERPRIAMTLTPYPSLSGRVTVTGSGAAASDAAVKLFRTNSSSYYAQRAEVDDDGNYRFAVVSPGTYVVQASAPLLVDQAYPAVECESEVPTTACPTASSLQFQLGTADTTADFQLRAAPKVTGQLFAGQPVPGGIYYSSDSVRLYTSSQAWIPAATLAVDAAAGTYVLSDFAPGNYFVAAVVRGFFGQLSDRVDCEPVDYGLPTCPWNLATSHALGVNDAVHDFSLRRAGRSARVTSASGEPLAGVALDLWNPSGLRVHTAVTGADGRAVLQVGSYYSPTQVRLSTDNYAGYLDEVYDNLPCPYGKSVYRGGCTLAGAASLTMPTDDPNLSELQIVLELSPTVFAHGFE